jgi:hypothetical protein
VSLFVALSLFAAVSVRPRAREAGEVRGFLLEWGFGGRFTRARFAFFGVAASNWVATGDWYV